MKSWLPDVSPLLLNAIRGLPAISGVLIGFYFYPKAFSLLSIGFHVLLLLLGFLLRYFGVKNLREEKIVLGQGLLEWWILITVPIMSCYFMLLVFLGQQAATWVQVDHTNTANDDLIKILVSSLVSAIATFFATLWVKDIQESGGFFSPEGTFKTEVQNLFRTKPLKDSPPTRKEYSAVYYESVWSTSTSGWALPARSARAKIMDSYLRP